jgi:hypothetical protein
MEFAARKAETDATDSEAKIDEDLLTFDIPDDGLEPTAKRRASIHFGNIALTLVSPFVAAPPGAMKRAKPISKRCPNSRACNRAGIAADMEQRCGQCKGQRICELPGRSENR